MESILIKLLILIAYIYLMNKLIKKIIVCKKFKKLIEISKSGKRTNKEELYQIIDELNQAFKYKTLTKYLHTNLGYVYMLIESYEKALYHLQKALEIDKNFKPAVNNIVHIYLLFKENKNAKDLMEKIINKKFLPLENIINIALIEANLGNIKKAEDYYYKSLRIKSNFSNTYVYYAILAIKLKKYDEVKDFLNKALNYNKNDPKIYYIAGLCHLHNKNYERAKLYFLKAIKIDKNFTSPYYGLLKVEDYYNNKEKVEEYCKKCKEVRYLMDKDKIYNKREIMGILKNILKYCSEEKYEECLKELYLFRNIMLDQDIEISSYYSGLEKYEENTFLNIAFELSNFDLEYTEIDEKYGFKNIKNNKTEFIKIIESNLKQLN